MIRPEDVHPENASDDDVLTVVAGVPAWATPTGAGGTLDGLTDVDTTGVADGDVLTYDSGTTTWLPVAPSGGGGSALVNRSLGLSYTLPNTPNASYPDAAAVGFFDGTSWTGRKLTDGVYGGGYTSGQNVGFSASDGVVKFDLTSSANVEKVVCRGRHGTGGVYRPISFKVEYSDDDVSYTSAFNVTGLAEGGQPGDQDWLAVLPFTGSSHRYWKITLGKSAIGGSFLFVNEVEMWG